MLTPSILDPLRAVAAATLVLAGLAGCAHPGGRTRAEPVPQTRPLSEVVLPSLPVRQTDPPPENEDAEFPQLSKLPPGPPVTLSARNVDVRSLLAALAEDAGISLVFDEAVTGRVSVNLREVPAVEAMKKVLEAAGLTIASETTSPWPPVVFYALPVNVNLASAELIHARFGVSTRLAQWLVAQRVR